MDEIRFSKERLAALIKERDTSDYKLAKQTGISRTMIYYLRMGQRSSTSAEYITKLAKALDTSVDYLLGRDEEKQQLPEPIRQLSKIAENLSEARQEELLRIAAALEKLEREQEDHPLPSGSMDALLSIYERIKQGGGNEDVLASLEALLYPTGVRRSGGHPESREGIDKSL